MLDSFHLLSTINKKGFEMNKNFIRIIVLIALAVSVIAIYSIFILTPPAKKLSSDTYLDHGKVLIGGDFELIDHNDKIVTNKDYAGKLMLVYFGFTFCPDVCPAALNKMTEVLNILDKYKIDIYPLFITIDPKRDGVVELKSYLSHFHPKIIGLTHNEEQIKKIADKYKVYYQLDESRPVTENEYMLDHSSFFYLMDKKGNYITHFGSNAEVNEIVETIRINK